MVFTWHGITPGITRRSVGAAAQARLYLPWWREGSGGEPRRALMAASTAIAHAQVASQIHGVKYSLYLSNCLDWMDARAPNSIHSIVTDPPYGLKEYTATEKDKLRKGSGGVWRIPPSFDGCKRSPVPRFTVLSEDERDQLGRFFYEFSRRALRVLVPGGHLFIATNPLLSHLVYLPLMQAGFEKRAEIIRLVQTLRGGDRPKNAHDEFSEVTVMPRSAWEPWGLFRKPCEGRVQDNLRKWKTGGLRRISREAPFSDVILSSPTRPEERSISPHPSLKPQSFMRQIVRASLPLGTGIVLDPFMGGGSTISAAIAVGYESIGVELDPMFLKIAAEAIPKLAHLNGNGKVNNNGGAPEQPTRQQNLALAGEP
jgi:DNA modification methylase